MSEKSRILILDDEKNYLLVLEALLSDAGYDVTPINDPEMAVSYLEEAEVDVVITDMKMPKMSGLDVLQQIKRSSPSIPVLIMTAFGSIESAVEVMKYGAFDYITKPFANDELLLSVHNAVELSRAHQQYRILQESLEERYSTHQIIGKSPAMRETLSIVDRVSASRSTVLITGESGTGKELVARAIHFSSPRKDEPFVAVNCMAFNAGVLESELFGHEKGSFTGAVAMRRGRFEQADRGTLFLDEIGELPPDLQVKLLRVLQERVFERVGGTEPVKVDIRIVAATNKDLAKMVEEGRFREDLYYRLNVVQIHIPPLRERREDIPLLVRHYLRLFRSAYGRSPLDLPPEEMDRLAAYDWPGNIRELRNRMEQFAVLQDLGSVLPETPPSSVAAAFPTEPEAASSSASDAAAPAASDWQALLDRIGELPSPPTLPQVQDRYMKTILSKCAGRIDGPEGAAELLGVSRSSLYAKRRNLLESPPELPGKTF